MEHEDEVREFFVPASRPPGPLSHPRASRGLVVALHPYGGTPAGVFQRVFALWEAGFDLVMPAGVRNSWNAAECCGEAQRRALNDTGFVAEVALEAYSVLAASRGWDPRAPRAFVTGYSNGGFLTHAVSLRAARGDAGFEWVRGAASQAGEVMNSPAYDSVLASRRARPIPVLIMHGLDDDFVRPDGCCPARPAVCCCGITDFIRSKYADDCSTTSDALARWARINGCAADDGAGSGASSGAERQPRLAPLQTSAARCEAGTSCRAATVACSYANAGHRLDTRAARNLLEFMCWLAGSEGQASPASPASPASQPREPTDPCAMFPRVEWDGRPQPTRSPTVVVAVLVEGEGSEPQPDREEEMAGAPTAGGAAAAQAASGGGSRTLWFAAGFLLAGFAMLLVARLLRERARRARTSGFMQLPTRPTASQQREG